MPYFGGAATGLVRLRSRTTPGLSLASEGRIYFDSALNAFVVSENGGAYVPLTNPTSGGGWTDDGTVVRLTTATDQVGIGTATPDPTAKVEIDASAGGFYIGLSVRSGSFTTPGAGSASERFGFAADSIGNNATSAGNSALRTVRTRWPLDARHQLSTPAPRRPAVSRSAFRLRFIPPALRPILESRSVLP